MVDYSDRAQRQYDAAMRDPSTMADGDDSDEERIHSDQIGEYKSEYVRVKFDKTSAELPVNRELFDDNKEIKQVDLNELGYNVHILREGQYREKIFWKPAGKVSLGGSEEAMSSWEKWMLSVWWFSLANSTISLDTSQPVNLQLTGMAG